MSYAVFIFIFSVVLLGGVRLGIALERSRALKLLARKDAIHRQQKAVAKIEAFQKGIIAGRRTKAA